MPKGKIVQIKARTRVDAFTGLMLATVILSSVALLGGLSSFMAGIFSAPVGRCQETVETANSFASSSVPFAQELFKRFRVSGWEGIKFFNVDAKSSVQCGVFRMTANADQCLADVCKGRFCKTAKVSSCLSTDKNCRLQEFFAVDSKTLFGSKSGSWNYACPNGCLNGACLPEVACHDSDAGEGAAYVAGYVSGKDRDGNPVTNYDYCTDWTATSTVATSTGSSVMEYSCSGGRVVGNMLPCENGCVDGACVSISTNTDSLLIPPLSEAGSNISE